MKLKVTVKLAKSNLGHDLVTRLTFLAGLVFCGGGCGPRAHIPALPPALAGALQPGEPRALMVRSLAPVLYIQRDEWFPLSRSVAILHPTRPIVGYHLLWRDDVNGSEIPLTV